MFTSFWVCGITRKMKVKLNMQKIRETIVMLRTKEGWELDHMLVPVKKSFYRCTILFYFFKSVLLQRNIRNTKIYKLLHTHIKLLCYSSTKSQFKVYTKQKIYTSPLIIFSVRSHNMIMKFWLSYSLRVSTWAMYRNA